MLNAEKIGCHHSSVIVQSNKLRFIELRRRRIQKSLKENVQITESNNFRDFWEILECNLLFKYHVKPTHSLQEIEILNNLFPAK